MGEAPRTEADTLLEVGTRRIQDAVQRLVLRWSTKDLVNATTDQERLMIQCLIAALKALEKEILRDTNRRPMPEI